MENKTLIIRTVFIFLLVIIGSIILIKKCLKPKGTDPITSQQKESKNNFSDLKQSSLTDLKEEINKMNQDFLRRQILRRQIKIEQPDKEAIEIQFPKQLNDKHISNLSFEELIQRYENLQENEFTNNELLDTIEKLIQKNYFQKKQLEQLKKISKDHLEKDGLDSYRQIIIRMYLNLLHKDNFKNDSWMNSIVQLTVNHIKKSFHQKKDDFTFLKFWDYFDERYLFSMNDQHKKIISDCFYELLNECQENLQEIPKKQLDLLFIQISSFLDLFEYYNKNLEKEMKMKFAEIIFKIFEKINNFQEYQNIIPLIITFLEDIIYQQEIQRIMKDPKGQQQIKGTMKDINDQQQIQRIIKVLHKQFLESESSQNNQDKIFQRIWVNLIFYQYQTDSQFTQTVDHLIGRLIEAFDLAFKNKTIQDIVFLLIEKNSLIFEQSERKKKDLNRLILEMAKQFTKFVNSKNEEDQQISFSCLNSIFIYVKVLQKDFLQEIASNLNDNLKQKLKNDVGFHQYMNVVFQINEHLDQFKNNGIEIKLDEFISQNRENFENGIFFF